MNKKQLDQRVKRINERALKAVGGPESLFAFYAEKVTPKDAYVSWRIAKAKFGEHTFYSRETKAFVWLQVFDIENFARINIGKEWTQELREYCWRTYSRSVEYHRSFWYDVLTSTKEVVLRWDLKFDPLRANAYFPEGRYLEAAAIWPPSDYSPLLTVGEFKIRWPLLVEIMQPTKDELRDWTLTELIEKLRVVQE